ncbi:MAG TPA: hypothetical protein VMV05_03645, partial [bacterium]|nr:hypothetical protein [bacterium]
FVVESFRDEPCDVTVTFPETGAKLKDAVSEKTFDSLPVPTPDPNNWWARQSPPAPKTDFKIQVQPHSYRVFSFEK